MVDLTQTIAEIQTALDNVSASDVGKVVPSKLTDTMSVSAEKSGLHAIEASSANAPSTDRSVLFTSMYDVAGSNLNYGHLVLTESNELFFNVNNAGSLGTWFESATLTGTQTLTNKTLTAPTVTGGTFTGVSTFTGNIVASGGNIFGTGDTLWLYGGVSGDPGFNIGIVGPDHASFANDLLCYTGLTGSDLELHYDFSQSLWDFQANDLTTTGTVTVGTLIVGTSTPASASATGTAGTIVWDADYIYTCVATDTWKRAALSTW